MDRETHLKEFFACASVSECSKFFVRDCIRRAELIEAKIERGLIEPQWQTWAKAKAETYRAEAAEEIRNAQ